MNFKTKNQKPLVKASDYTPDDSEETMVSICVGTYNQKKYVAQCLDSLLSQLVNFKIEILINDDASTDGTQEILLDYQKKYPQIVKVFLAKENQFQKIKQYSVVYRVHSPRICGKYVALCDSDDYYCNNMVLYYKVKILETHPNCNACFSRVKKIDDADGRLLHLMPKKWHSSGIISSRKLINMFVKNYCFQTSSYFFRSNLFINFCNNYPEFAKKINVFDEAVVMYFGYLGNVFYYNKISSVYRKFSNNSWSNNKHADDVEKKKNNQLARIDYLRKFNSFTAYKFDKACRWGIAHSKISIYQLEDKYAQILNDKELSRFYRKRYFKSYIKIKYFK